MALGALVFTLCLFQAPTTYADIEKAYGVKVEIPQSEFTVKPGGYTVSGKPATDAELKKYEPLFVKEWSLYPPSLMSKAKVTRIVNCRDLKVGEQERAAVPAFEIDTMYYDPALGSYSPQYQRNVVHHEFFHMIDQRMGVMRRDKEWSALNASDFRYGNGGRYMRNGNAGALRTDIPGFLSAYGTSAVEEDKAELFGHLVIDTTFVKDQALKDVVLMNKIGLLKKRLATFDSNMGDGFWGKVSGPKTLVPKVSH